jgi:hypothetical protein
MNKEVEGKDTPEFKNKPNFLWVIEHKIAESEEDRNIQCEKRSLLDIYYLTKPITPSMKLITRL